MIGLLGSDQDVFSMLHAPVHSRIASISARATRRGRIVTRLNLKTLIMTADRVHNSQVGWKQRDMTGADHDHFPT